MSVTFRLGRPDDAERLSQVHAAVSPGDFICQLGLRFLRHYYRTMLAERFAVVVCAVDGHEIGGMVTGSLRAEEHMAALRQHRYRLLGAAAPALGSRWSLVRMVYERYAATDGDDFVVTSGAHGEFWGVHEAHRNTVSGIELLSRWLKVMRGLGGAEIRVEIDALNRTSRGVHRILGGKIVREYVLPSGAKRLVVQHR